MKGELHAKCSFFLSDFNEPWIFSADFPKNTDISNFVKIRPLGTRLFHAVGQTYIKVIIAFRNFANAPKYEPIHNTELYDPHTEVTGFSYLLRSCSFETCRLRSSIPS